MELMAEISSIGTSHDARKDYAVNYAPRGLKELAQSFDWIDAPVNMQRQESRHRIHNEFRDMLDGLRQRQ